MARLDDLAEAIAAKLVARGETVAVAESAAGGLISAALLGVAGASAYYKGDAVVYNAEGIKRLVGLTDEDLARDRSATPPRAALLAATLRSKLDATWAVAETGAAGPTGNRYGDPAGHAALAVAGPAERSDAIKTGDADRRRNMEAFAFAALTMLNEAIDGA